MKFTWDGNKMIQGDKPKFTLRDFVEQNKYGLLLWSFVVALWWWRIGSHWVTNNVIKPFITI